MPLELMLRATEREARVWLKLWRSGVFSNFVAPVLMLVAMGVGLGGLIDSDRRELEGLEYLAFVTPGLLIGTAMQGGAGHSLWPVMAGHRWIGFYYAQVASPMGPKDVYGGVLLWGSVRALLQSSIFLAAGAALGGVASWWGVLAIPVAALTTLAFAAPLAAFAATQDSDASFDVIMRVLVMPLFLFSGTLFPIDQLPLPIQVAAKLFPLLHGIELARSDTTGSADVAAVAVHVVVMFAYISLGWRWGVAAFARRLTA